MKITSMVFFASAALLLSSCNTLKPLDQTSASNLRAFAPDAVASSTQFLRGIPVSSEGATQLVQQFSKNNPKIQALWAKAPQNFGAAFTKFQTQAVVVNPRAGCGVPSNSPMLKDTDEDGIKDNFDYTFNCLNTLIGDLSVDLTGRIDMDDLNDNDDSSGYNLNIDGLKLSFSNTSTGDKFVFVTNNKVQLRIRAGGGFAVQQTFNFRVTAQIDGETINLSYGTDGSLVYTPTGSSGANRFAQGTLKFDLKFFFAFNNDRSEFSMKTTNLQVDQINCPSTTAVNAGTLTFTEGSNSLVWTIQDTDDNDDSACGDGTWTFNGQPLDNSATN